MPTSWINGRGNAAHWVSSAQEDGIPVDQTPHKGDVAILLIGYFGHAMYVEDVYDNGTMRVSQYNYNYDGNYSQMTMPSYRSDMYFIHFP
jgi:surface antigen